MSPSAAVEGPSGTLSERELGRAAALARAGDDRAFAALVRHFDPPLRALAFRLLGDRDLMDDVLQEAYVKAYRALPRFRGEAALGTWLYRVTYNACMDELRRMRRGAAAELPLSAAERRPAPGADPGERVAERDALEAALAALAPEERAAVLLVDRDGLPYARAAEVMGVPPGTVASRLSRARAALRAALGAGPGEDAR